jgi:cobalamin synthase
VAVLSSLAVVALVVGLTHQLAALVAVLTALVIGILVSRFILGRIPGMTGDTYGATNMLIELGVLLTFVVAS